MLKSLFELYSVKWLMFTLCWSSVFLLLAVEVQDKDARERGLYYSVDLAPTAHIVFVLRRRAEQHHSCLDTTVAPTWSSWPTGKTWCLNDICSFCFSAVEIGGAVAQLAVQFSHRDGRVVGFWVAIRIRKYRGSSGLPHSRPIVFCRHTS